MKENPKFIGRLYTEDEKKNLNATLSKWSEKSSERIEGESEKTEEEIKMIGILNSIIKSELESLGIEIYDPILLDKIHILPSNIFIEKFPNTNSEAFFLSIKDAIYINKDKVDTKVCTFSALLHELIHRASTIKLYADNNDGIYDARVGYRIRSPWKKPERENRLRGFNELMTDHTVYKILIKNQKLLQNFMNISREDIKGPIYSYMHYAPILESIVKKVAEDKNLSHLEVFDDFERGQFKDDILILKDVEKSFGKGSLEILSLLEIFKNKENNDKLEIMIKEFFSEEDDSKRQAIHDKILTFVNNTLDRDAYIQE